MKTNWKNCSILPGYEQRINEEGHLETRKISETEKRYRVTYSIEVSAPTAKKAEALAWLQISECNADASVEEITPAQSFVQITGINTKGESDGL